MRKILLNIAWISSFLFLFLTNVEAQLFKRVENKVKNRVDRKIDRAIDKGLDEIEDGLSGKNKPQTTSTNTSQASTNTGNSQGNIELNTSPDFSTVQYSSKYDFIPGSEIIFFDDFTQDAIGDFPNRWNTNASGEVVQIKGYGGKWLRVPDNTIAYPEISSTFPSNFTIEFDLIYPERGMRPPVNFGFSEEKNLAKNPLRNKALFSIILGASSKEAIGYTTSIYSGQETKVDWPVEQGSNKLHKVCIAVNGSRFRLYIDGNKVFDAPKAFDKQVYRNNFHFRASPLLPAPKDAFYITNLRIAASTKDARSLLSEGKYETSGIYFQTGSSKILPNSHPVLKSVAEAMNTDASIRIEIIGHTDNVGSASSNQALSEQRAIAVREYLHKELGIDKNRIQTSGKGASSPIADNNTTDGKAKNRRVTFIKL